MPPTAVHRRRTGSRTGRQARRSSCRRRLASILLVLATGSAACASSDDPTIDATGAGSHADDIAAEVASFDLVADRPGRFLVGVFGADRRRLVGYGTVKLDFRYLGAADEPLDQPEPGRSLTAGFLPIPGQPADRTAPAPRFVTGSEIIGVYGAERVAFDRPGFWEVEVIAEIDGDTRSTTTAFEVLADSAIPAPGDPAPRTRQPLIGDTSVPAHAIDSRAGVDEPVPDPELHDETIADAIAAGRPVMVVISTPTFCQSRFCGPITDTVRQLAKEHGDEIAFVHLEIWRDFEAGELNPGVRDWIAPDGADGGREPWVFTVGHDGHIVDRFDNVATDAELRHAIERLRSP